jgi:hypothetical protein
VGINMAVSQNTICEDAFNTIYDILYDNLVDPKGRSVRWIFAEYPSNGITSSSDLPIIIVGNPMISSVDTSFGIITYTISVSIDIFPTSPKTTDELMSDILNDSILRENKLMKQTIDSTNTELITIDKNAIKTHVNTINYSFEYSFERT